MRSMIAVRIDKPLDLLPSSKVADRAAYALINLTIEIHRVLNIAYRELGTPHEESHQPQVLSFPT
jgi:hypothetical protein